MKPLKVEELFDIVLLSAISTDKPNTRYIGDNMEETEEQGISEKDLKALNAIVDDFDDGEDVSREAETDDNDYDEDDIAGLKFSEDIKILLINSTDLRIICHFVGCNSVKDVKNSIYKHVTMIGMMSQQCLIPFMKSKDYSFAGEIYFADGQPIPVSKQTWHIGGKDVTFTDTGYMFFEAKNGIKKDNLVALVWVDGRSGLAGITLYSTSEDKSKEMLAELEVFTKKHNCIRGAKLRDVNMSSGTFSEVAYSKKHNWENYYFPKNIREMYKLEVFGFLNSTDRYNALNIHKRGVLMYGNPGCVLADTKIRVRKVSDKGSHTVFIE